MMRFLCDPRVVEIKPILENSSLTREEKTKAVGDVAAKWWSQYFKTPELKQKVLIIFNLAVH